MSVLEIVNKYKYKLKQYITNSHDITLLDEILLQFSDIETRLKVRDLIYTILNDLILYEEKEINKNLIDMYNEEQKRIDRINRRKQK